MEKQLSYYMEVTFRLRYQRGVMKKNAKVYTYCSGAVLLYDPVSRSSTFDALLVPESVWISTESWVIHLHQFHGWGLKFISLPLKKRCLMFHIAHSNSSPTTFVFELQIQHIPSSLVLIPLRTFWMRHAWIMLHSFTNVETFDVACEYPAPRFLLGTPPFDALCLLNIQIHIVNSMPAWISH
jgi:hypothetical protein